MNLLRHLTKLEYLKVWSKLKKNNKELANKYFKLITKYERYLADKKWFYNQLKDYKFERDEEYYIERHKWRHYKYDY